MVAYTKTCLIISVAIPVRMGLSCLAGTVKVGQGKGSTPSPIVM